MNADIITAAMATILTSRPRRVDQIFGDAGSDLIHWDYANLTLGTVIGGSGVGPASTAPENDILEKSSGTSGWTVCHHHAGGGPVRVTNQGGRGNGSITGTGRRTASTRAPAATASTSAT